MKLFIKHSVLFGIFSSLIYVIVISLSSDYNDNIVYKQQGGHMYTRLNEIVNYSNVDVLFIGSSHAYRGFDTRLFSKAGISSFNLGSSSQAPVQSCVLLQQYLDRVNPKTIVFEVSPLTFSSDGLESSLDIISNSKMDLYSIGMLLQVNHIKLYNTFLYSAVQQLLHRNTDFVQDKTIGKDTYISGGYVQRDENEFRFRKPKDKSIKTEQMTAFKKIVRLINSKGIRLVLVQTPLTQKEYNSYSENKSFDEIMSVHSTYFNFNELITLNDSVHFYDPNHLNQNGVNVFNKKLIELLVN
jgi:hypothetical protein